MAMGSYLSIIKRKWVECPNIRIIGVPEEDKKKDYEKILEEIIVENVLKIDKEIFT